MTSVTKHSWMVNHMLCIILCLALVAVSSFITNHPAPRRASCFMINLQQIPSLTIECIFLHLLSLICGTEHYKSGRGFRTSTSYHLSCTAVLFHLKEVGLPQPRKDKTIMFQQNTLRALEREGQSRTSPSSPPQIKLTSWMYSNLKTMHCF